MKHPFKLALIALLASPFLMAAGTKLTNASTGYKIGTAASQKIGFYGTTPAVQPTSANQTAVTDNTGGSVSNATLADTFTQTTAITDNSTGSGSTTIAAGAGVYDLILPAPPNLSTLSTGGVDVITNMVPGHKFKILSWEFITTLAGTNSGATLAFNLEIGSTDVGTTPSTCTVNLAGTSDIGERTAGTTVTGANTGSASDTLSLEVAGGGTAFTAGTGFFVVKIQNMDTADAIASLASRANEARTDASAATDAIAKIAELANAIRSALVTVGLIAGS